MVKHIILWNLKEEFSESEKKKIKEDAKVALEGLVGVVPGLLEMKIQTEYLETSNAELMLDSTLEDNEALKNYLVHPKHVDVANNFVRPFVAKKSCIDFEM